MANRTAPIFKHISRPGILLAVILAGSPAVTHGSVTDLTALGERAWVAADSTWSFENNEIKIATQILNGVKTDPAASTFLVSQKIFGGDIAVSMDVTFDEGRYLGVYLDFGQESQTGIWMGTGHALAGDAPANEIERAYIKTVEHSYWIVRATGELVVESGTMLRLRFVRSGDAYSIWNDETQIATYYKAGGYPAGPLQIRLTNASARIHRLEVVSDWID